MPRTGGPSPYSTNNSPEPRIGYAPGHSEVTVKDLSRFIAPGTFGADQRTILLLHQMATHIRQLEYELREMKLGSR